MASITAGVSNSRVTDALSLEDCQCLGPSILVSNDVIASFLFEVVRTLLSRPVDTDLFQRRVIFEDTQRGRDHAFVNIFVSFS